MEKFNFLEAFNPANAKTPLTEEALAAIGQLTPDEISQLAKAYPNKKGQRNYLVLRDKTVPDNRQLNSTSSWENLAALYKIGNTQYVAAGFVATFDRKRASASSIPQAKVQDLTPDQLKAELKPKNKPKAEAQNLGEGSNVNDDLPNLDSKTPPAKAAAKKATAKKSAAKKGANK